MSATRTQPLADLYETDETAWLEAMARISARGDGADLDYPHLAEYLSDMAKRDRREVDSRLIVLLAHLLKWQYQPDKRSRGWRLTIAEQRQELTGLLTSRTLRNHAAVVLSSVYAYAVERAVIDTGLAASELPAACPYTLDEALHGLAVNEPTTNDDGF